MRPGIIQPLHGIKSGTKPYRAFYVAAAPPFPIAKALFPRHVLTTETLGKAMIQIAISGRRRRSSRRRTSPLPQLINFTVQSY